MNKLFLQSIKRSNPKILALAKNYLPAGSKDVPSNPIIFTKPCSSILFKGENLVLNTKSQINYEIELGVVIGTPGKNIDRKHALDHVGGYFLCLDMTDWGLLSACKVNGAPWEISKGQDGFLPISDFIPKDRIPNPHNVSLKLAINSKQEVDHSTKDMFFKIDHIIEYISSVMTLNQGDLILTGTPKLGPVFNGDKLNAKLIYQETQLAQIDVDVINKDS